MKIKTISQKDKARREKEKRENAVKTYRGEWYTLNSILGNDWAIFFCLLGGREAGKSYAAMKYAVTNKLKKGDKLKFYWMRLTDGAADNLLANGGDKLVDPDLKKKYNIKTFRKNKTLYTYKEKERKTRTGRTVKEKEDVKEFCEVLSCSTFYNTKGVGYFDNTFDGEYIIILDEMNRENSEKNSFDIVYNFVNLLENVVRSTKTKIKVIMIGNTLDESSDILAAFNFIPDHFGRFKLKRKRAVIDYIAPNEKYKSRRKGTISDILLPNASTFTNAVEIDRSLLVSPRSRRKPSYIIKFNKDSTTWYTVWDDRIISPYNKEEVVAYPMRRYLDEVFKQEVYNNVVDMFDNRYFRFTTISIFKRFQKSLKLLKRQ